MHEPRGHSCSGVLQEPCCHVDLHTSGERNKTIGSVSLTTDTLYWERACGSRFSSMFAWKLFDGNGLLVEPSKLVFSYLDGLTRSLCLKKNGVNCLVSFNSLWSEGSTVRWNLSGVFSMPLVEGNLSNRFGSRDLSFVGWKNKAVERLIAQARLAAVRCVCVVVHT